MAPSWLVALYLLPIAAHALAVQTAAVTVVKDATASAHADAAVNVSVDAVCVIHQVPAIAPVAAAVTDCCTAASVTQQRACSKC